jgi:hypothetical protein
VCKLFNICFCVLEKSVNLICENFKKIVLPSELSGFVPFTPVTSAVPGYVVQISTCGRRGVGSPKGAQPHSTATFGHRVSGGSSSKIISAGMLSRHSSQKGRCYVHLSVYGYPLMAIVDTGADKTYLGAKIFQLCQSLNVQIQKHPNTR